MQRKENFLPFFLVFFGLSLVLILVGRTGFFDDVTYIFNRTVVPGRTAANFLTLKSVQNKVIKNLAFENAQLKKKLADEKNIMDENHALKSQFAISESTSQNLLSAKIIGEPGFVPGVSLPEYLIINKGEKAGIKVGNAVIFQNYLVGKVIKTYPDFSKIELITNKNSSFIAKVASGEEIVGVMKGQGGEEIIMDNVLLSAQLKKDSEVTTKGDKDENGNGYPPDLGIGKIISVEKKQSDLFQKASVKSPIDFKNLEMVFVIR